MFLCVPVGCRIQAALVFFSPESSKNFSSSSSLSSIFAFLEVVAGFPFLSPIAPGVGTLEEGECSKWNSFLDC